VGRAFSETPRTPAGAEIEVYSEAMADMFSAWLRELERS
jgi:hypothetical protein